MLTKTMKWVSITVILLALLWPSLLNHQVALEILICVGALLVVAQAWRAGKYSWAAGFVAIAVLFNPVLARTVSPPVFIGLGWVSIASFVLSLAGFTEKPLAPMPGIINQIRRFQSQFSR